MTLSGEVCCRKISKYNIWGLGVLVTSDFGIGLAKLLENCTYIITMLHVTVSAGTYLLRLSLLPVYLYIISTAGYAGRTLA